MPNIPEVLVDGDPIDYSGLPEGLRGGVECYLIHGVLPGSFLKSIIINDLRGAVLYADDQNVLLLRGIVKWFINHAPPQSHGSYVLMDCWARFRGTGRSDPNA